MVKVFIKYRVHISVILLILELSSCIFNPFSFEYLKSNLFFLLDVILLMFLHYIICGHGVAHGQDIMNWFGTVFFSITLCGLSFIKRDPGYTSLSLAATSVAITEIVFIKVFNIKVEPE